MDGQVRLARYGIRELVVASAVLFLAACGSLWVSAWLVLPFLLLWGLVVWFFRDPVRRIPAGDQNILAPADGRVVEIAQVDEPHFIGGPAIKIGIFLSIFDAHINRAPCRGRVAFLKYQPGQFRNAMRPVASEVNESNAIGLEASNKQIGKALVKQIAGLIARRIVCECRVNDFLEAGQSFGMIKFGSRTEIYVPAEVRLTLRVKVGDKVLAGESIIGVVE